MDLNTIWKTCSACKKKSIHFLQKYYECSVTTCTGKRTGYVFCSVGCWECHVPGAKHRNAWAVEKIAPSFEQWQKMLSSEDSSLSKNDENMDEQSQEPAQTQVSAPAQVHKAPSPHWQAQAQSSNLQTQTRSVSQAQSKLHLQSEVLIVVSKMKNYIKEMDDMNTSGDVADVLSDIVRWYCDRAIETARRDGRKTVMARDFTKPTRY